MRTVNTQTIAEQLSGINQLYSDAAEALEASGGFTFMLEWNRDARPMRYVVGDGRKGVFMHTMDLFRPEIFNEVLRTALDEGFEGIGGWIENGNVYIDPITTHGNEATAMMVAEERGEIAFWDTVNEVSIYTEVNHVPA